MSDDMSGWIIGSDWARAVGRFNPEGPDGYRAVTMPHAPLRKTRDEAVADEVQYRGRRDENIGTSKEAPR